MVGKLMLVDRELIASKIMSKAVKKGIIIPVVYFTSKQNATLWNKFKAWLWKLFCFLHEPKTEGEIDYASVYAMIKLCSPACQIYLADEKYKLPTVQSIKDFLLKDLTNLSVYVPIWHDCDDSAFHLLGVFNNPNWSAFAVGFAWSKVHAFNIFIGEDMKLYIIEPQTDEVILYEDAKDIYHPLELAVM